MKHRLASHGGIGLFVWIVLALDGVDTCVSCFAV